MSVDPNEYTSDFSRLHTLTILRGGTITYDPHPFYGYYTIHVVKGGEVYGTLSVNGYDGEVWYQFWHGARIQSRETH